MGRDEEPKTLIEYIAKDISLQDYPDGYPENYAGFEWWSQVRDEKEDITFHYDKDEGLATREKKYIHPMKTTITYLTNVGGPTAIFPKVGGITDVIKSNEYNTGYLSFPKVNKHVIANGHFFHGVIGPLSKINPSEDLKRITLVINYWYQKPIEPNCIHLPRDDRLPLIPLTDEHVRLQKSIQRKKEKMIKMNYKNGVQNIKIFRNKTPVNLTFGKNLRDGRTYLFKMKDKPNLPTLSVKTFSSF